MELKLVLAPKKRPRLLLNNKEIKTFKLQFEPLQGGTDELAAVCVVPTPGGNVLYTPLTSLYGELSCDLHEAAGNEILR